MLLKLLITSILKIQLRAVSVAPKIAKHLDIFDVPPENILYKSPVCVPLPLTVLGSAPLESGEGDSINSDH